MEEFEDIQDMQLSELVEANHDALMGVMDKVLIALSAEKKDVALHKLIANQLTSLTELSTKISALATKEVKVETNQDKVVKAIETLNSTLSKSIQELSSCVAKLDKPMVEAKKKQFEFVIGRDINGKMNKITAVEK